MSSGVAAVAPPVATAHRSAARSERPYLLAGAALLVALAAAAAARSGQPLTALVSDLVVLLAVAGLAFLLLRRPWLAPWAVLLLFPTTAELQLRVTSSAGLSKDALIAFLALVTLYHLRNVPELAARLRPLASPLAALGVLAALYLADPGGTHGSDWAFGARLLLEGLCLLAIGLLSSHPERAVPHLVWAMCVITAFEAVFAWVQQSAGLNTLVYSWGYEYGSQVRQTSSGGLRTSGTFADPFQLAALAVLALCVAAFLATRTQAVVLVLAAIAIIAATSVRTAFIQVALVAVLYALKRRWYVQTGAVLAAVAAAGLFAGLTITSVPYPGGPHTPLLLGLNGRSTAWSLAVTDTKSLLVGHGVGAVGSGSTRGGSGLVTKAAAFDPTKAPTAVFAGNSAFLDSSYAQVQSDVGITGIAAMLIWIVGTFARLRRPLRRGEGPAQLSARWAAIAVLAVSALDWIGRTTLGSYTTGFLTLYLLGVLLAAASARTTAATS